MDAIETNRSTPFKAVHPLDIVKEGIAERSISEKDFACRIGDDLRASEQMTIKRGSP